MFVNVVLVAMMMSRPILDSRYDTQVLPSTTTPFVLYPTIPDTVMALYWMFQNHNYNIVTIRWDKACLYNGEPEVKNHKLMVRKLNHKPNQAVNGSWCLVK